MRICVPADRRTQPHHSTWFAVALLLLLTAITLLTALITSATSHAGTTDTLPPADLVAAAQPRPTPDRLMTPAPANLPLRTQLSAYGPHERNTMQAHWIADGRTHPGVVLIHGGHWTEGSREQFDALLPSFHARGYSTFTPHYRYNDQAAWPAQRDDLTSALGYICAQAQAFHVDPSRLFLVGFSAGGHLALTQGLLGDDHHVAGIIAISAPADPWRAYTDGVRIAHPSAAKLRRNAARLIGCLPARLDATDPCWQRWSSSQAAQAASPHDPPTLLLTTGADFVSPAHSRSTASALRAVGVQAQVELYPGSAHSLEVLRLPGVSQRIFTFLDQISHTSARTSARRGADQP